MYNLNYTYLTDLEVDTRQTFADISDDLILLSHNNGLEKTSVKTLISSWQNFFWESPIEKKKNLNVIFTDISVDHTLFKGEDEQQRPFNFLKDNEMMTRGELDEFFDDMDHGGEGDTGKWCGKWTFEEMITELSSVINDLHTRMLNGSNIYPNGSIVVTNNNPAAGNGYGVWKEHNASYIAENLKGASEDISVGFNAGKSDGKNVGSNLDNVVVKPTTLDPSYIPIHTHKLTFIPETGSGGSTDGPTERGKFQEVTKNARAGLDFTPGCTEYSGCKSSGAGSDNDAGLVAARDAWSTRETGGSAAPDFDTSPAAIEPSIKSINVAPKTFPIDAKLWERQS